MGRNHLRNKFEQAMFSSRSTRGKLVALRNVLADIQHYKNYYRLTPTEREVLNRANTQIIKMLELDSKSRLYLKPWHQDSLPYSWALELVCRYLYDTIKSPRFS